METAVALPANSEPLDFAPLEYFDRNCAECHGAYGSFYGDDFGAELKDTELVAFVEEMTAGPGGAPLTAKNLSALVAFHRSLIAGAPFLIWTAFNNGELRGEVTEGAQVSLRYRGVTLAVETNGATWRTVLPKAVTPVEAAHCAVLQAVNADGRTILKLSESAYSHALPLQEHGAGE